MAGMTYGCPKCGLDNRDTKPSYSRWEGNCCHLSIRCKQCEWIFGVFYYVPHPNNPWQSPIWNHD